MDNGLRIDGQPIDEIEDHRYNLGIEPEAIIAATNNCDKPTLASYMRKRAEWMRERAEPFDKLAELLENNEDLVKYIEGYVGGKCLLQR